MSERWFAVIRLRGQLNDRCAQAIFDSIVSDMDLLNALGAAKALMNMQGEPPSGMVTLINQGPGRHIREHVYRYERCISRELVKISRVKDIQVPLNPRLNALAAACPGAAPPSSPRS